MPKTKTGRKRSQPLGGPRKRTEFEAEGELTVSYSGGAPSFVLDDSHLSELAIYHFKPPIDEDGVRRFGKVKVLIIPVRE